MVSMIISIFSNVTRHQITQKGNETLSHIMINHFKRGKSQQSTLKAYKIPSTFSFRLKLFFLAEKSPARGCFSQSSLVLSLLYVWYQH